jgi:hypothetical protein
MEMYDNASLSSLLRHCLSHGELYGGRTLNPERILTSLCGQISDNSCQNDNTVYNIDCTVTSCFFSKNIHMMIYHPDVMFTLFAILCTRVVAACS